MAAIGSGVRKGGPGYSSPNKRKNRPAWSLAPAPVLGWDRGGGLSVGRTRQVDMCPESRNRCSGAETLRKILRVAGSAMAVAGLGSPSPRMLAGCGYLQSCISRNTSPGFDPHISYRNKTMTRTLPRHCPQLSPSDRLDSLIGVDPPSKRRYSLHGSRSNQTSLISTTCSYAVETAANQM